jgi:hypothetical protein
MQKRIFLYFPIVLGLILLGGCTKEVLMRYNYGFNFEAGISIFPTTALEITLVLSFLALPVSWLIQLAYFTYKQISFKYAIASPLIAVLAFLVPMYLPARTLMDGLHDRIKVEFSEEELLQIRDKIFALHKNGYKFESQTLPPLTPEEEFKSYGDLFKSHPKLLRLANDSLIRYPVITVREDSVQLRWFGSMGNPRGIKILTSDRELESDGFSVYRKIYPYVWAFRWYS